MRQNTDQSRLGTASGLGAIVLWSATFAFARGLSEKVGPLTAGTVAYLVGGTFCLLRLRWSRTSLRRFLELPRRYLVGCGFLFVLYTASIYLAVGLARDRGQLLEVALVNYLWPPLTVILAIPLLKQRANWLLAPGTGLALSGVVLVMTQGASVSWFSFWDHFRSNPAAYLCALLAAVAWALYSNLTRRWAVRGSGGAVELFVPATGLVLLAMRVCTQEPSGWDVAAAAQGFGLAVITTVAYILWDLAMRRGNLAAVAVCSYFTPLLSTLVSCLCLGVVPGPGLWGGCLLLVSGSLLSWRAQLGPDRP